MFFLSKFEPNEWKTVYLILVSLLNKTCIALEIKELFCEKPKKLSLEQGFGSYITMKLLNYNGVIWTDIRRKVTF